MTLATKGPRSEGVASNAWISPTAWWSRLQTRLAEQLAVTPNYQPRAGGMLTSRLRLVRPVNDGRGANVWLADHLPLAARVEVTFAESTANDANVVRNDLASQARAFRDRAEVAARIDDPRVVLVLEQGEVNGVPFMLTKALEGTSLRTRLLHGPIPLDEVLGVVRDAGVALGKAHSLGIAHGGLRPECLFSNAVAGGALLEIVGFGDADAALSSVRAQHSAVQQPAHNPYASPEQLLDGTASDVRSDLWSLAVTIYELLTTTLPFEAATPAGVTVAICNAQFAKPGRYRADLPPGIDGWFDAALAKDPARRFHDAAEFVQSFESALTAEAALASAPPLPDDSLEMDDDDGDDDEKTVKWDMPDDAKAIAHAPLASSSAGSARVTSLAMVSTPGSVSAPPRALLAAPLLQAPRLPAPVPPALEPGMYVDSPYMVSVMSALAVPSAAAPESMPARVRSRLFGSEGPLLTPDKTWLAALAFAAGVAVTWFVYEPAPEGEAVARGEAHDNGVIRAISVDDLPRVEGDEGLPRILQPSQLPRAVDDMAPVEPSAPHASGPSERRSVPSQSVQALAPAPHRAPPKAAAVASAAVASAAVASAAVPAASARAKPSAAASNCNPPYHFDSQGIRRLKSECLNGTRVIQGPYGAMITTNLSTKAPDAGKGASAKQARAGAQCTPPYYFDGKIRRLKVECL